MQCAAFDIGVKIQLMQPLGPPDTFHLSGAVGWFELGNFAEAKAELDRITPGRRSHPDVLEVRWMIHAREQDWGPALAAAEELVNSAPRRPSGWIHRAFALRRVKEGGLSAAWDALLPAHEKFPKEATIPYNLACYACQMSRLDEARLWLQRAIRIAGKAEIKSTAANDPDLEPLWPEIQKL